MRLLCPLAIWARQPPLFSWAHVWEGCRRSSPATQGCREEAATGGGLSLTLQIARAPWAWGLLAERGPPVLGVLAQRRLVHQGLPGLTGGGLQDLLRGSRDRGPLLSPSGGAGSPVNYRGPGGPLRLRPTHLREPACRGPFRRCLQKPRRRRGPRPGPRSELSHWRAAPRSAVHRKRQRPCSSRQRPGPLTSS